MDLMTPKRKLSPTRLVRGGKSKPVEGGHAVNPPVVRASTVAFDSIAAQRQARLRRARERIFSYGARGNPTGYALEDMLCELEGGHRARLFPTGMAAIAIAFIAYLKPGDHVLVSDCVYEPARRFATVHLARLGIRATFFSAADPDIESKIEPATRAVYVESPGSLVYEMLDLPALSRIANRRGLLLIADNTWGSGLQYRPLELGADVSVMAATKYLSGSSDVMMGTITATAEAWGAMTDAADDWGMTTSPDDAYLVLRGIRSLAARLAVHESNALALARWLSARPEVKTVFCPALPQHPGHEIWQRDCAGTNGLISFEMHSRAAADAEHFADALKLFAIGASWGGFESLVSMTDMTRARSVDNWSARGQVIRLHAGLEDAADLIGDLEAAFSAVQKQKN
jgi:cysteine-S-conjugate beta-lyase